MSLAAKAGSLLVRAGKLLTNCLCCCVGQCPNGIGECGPQCACSGGDCVPCRNTACPNGQQDCGTGCTCSGGQCVGCRETACPNGNECPEGCACVNGECVPPVGCCCANGQIIEGSTQEQCEQCDVTNYCQEYIYLENPEDSCPEGFTPDGWGGCSRTTTPASCAECDGWCYSWQSGLCGTWYPDCTTAQKYYISVTHNPFWSCGLRCGQWFMGSGFCEGPDGVLTYGYEADPSQVTIACNYTGQKGYYDTLAECEAAYAARIAGGPLEGMNLNCVWPPCHGNGCVGSCIDENNPLP